MWQDMEQCSDGRRGCSETQRRRSRVRGIRRPSWGRHDLWCHFFSKVVSKWKMNILGHVLLSVWLWAYENSRTGCGEVYARGIWLKLCSSSQDSGEKMLNRFTQKLKHTIARTSRNNNLKKTHRSIVLCVLCHICKAYTDLAFHM